MLGLSVTTRILLFTGATDMRKGFDGLSALVTAAGEDPYSGHLYVFVSRRRDRAKILAFQKGGMVLWHKRLDCGRFQAKTVTYDLARQMEGATEVPTSGFGDAIIANM